MRCDICGRYIAYADLESGKATSRMQEPDSIFGPEKWDNRCARCNEQAAKEKDK